MLRKRKNSREWELYSKSLGTLPVKFFLIICMETISKVYFKYTDLLNISEEKPVLRFILSKVN